jgi:hypothetical protein
MSEPAPRRRSSTGLRLADLNKTYPPINGVVETVLVTVLDTPTVEAAERNFFETIGEDRVAIWLINATAGHDLKSDARDAMGRFVARVGECGCAHVILVTPNDLFRMLFRSIMLMVRVRLDDFTDREEADRFLNTLREQRRREEP